MKAEAIAGRETSVWSSVRDWLARQLINIAPFATLLFLVIVFSALSPSFVTLDNLGNILRQVSVTAIIATGLTFVILTAEIDLSIAAIANATGIVVAFFTPRSPTSTSPTCRCPASPRSSWRCSRPSRSAASTPPASC